MTNQQIVDAALSVASIVRCADCVYFAEWDKPSDRHGDCMRRTSAGYGVIVEKTFFCAKGEQRGGKDKI